MVQQVVVDHKQVLQVVEVGKVEILVVHLVNVVGQRFHHPQGFIYFPLLIRNFNTRLW